MKKKPAVLIRTVRGGKDPCTYYTGVTQALAQKLDRVDPWKTLGSLVDHNDPRVLVAHAGSRREAERALADRGHRCIETLEVVGY